MAGQRPYSDLLYGRNAVIEALGGRRRLYRLLLAEGVERQPRITALLIAARERSLEVRRVSRHELDRLTGGANHQGVALEASSYPYVPFERLLAEAGDRPIVALDHLQDPQNLGTLLRSVDATGAGGVIMPDRRSASVTPAVVNASAGAVEHISVAQVPNLARAIEASKAAGYWAVALDAGDQAVDIFAATIPDPALLVVGAEGKGVGPALLRHADLMIRLPMLGTVESLNAAVAASVALYELLRRRASRPADDS